MNRFALHEHLTSLLRARAEEVGRHIASGSAEDFPQYKHLVGVLAGLRHAMDIIEEDKENQDKDEE